MPDHDARALLAEALDFFNDHPRFSLRRDRRRNSYELASRIDVFLTKDKSALPIVAAARDRWKGTDDLRIDASEQTVEADGDSYWVRAWARVSLVNVANTPGLGELYAHAIGALPEITRKVLLAHQRDEQDFGTIAAQLGINTHEVEQHIADALLSIGRALDRA